MANYPKKMNDPTEAALSAIQEALNVRDDEQPENAAASTPDFFVGPADSPRQNADIPTTNEHSAKASGAGTVADAAARAANDDQQSIGQILQALQRRPARSSYFVATLFSVAWIVGCVGLSLAYLSDLHAALGTGRSPLALLIGLGAAALLPIIFFFGVAHMAWRAQELRLIAQSMARVAMRLAEPEGVARDSIVTVGQAIRREVAAMGDGVERALARASELEALVQSEVAALERTYSDNEVRIRGLLQDLGNQRDTLVGQAEQVRSALGNVQIDLTHDLSSISELVGQQVNEAAERITRSLTEKGEHITSTLAHIGDNMIQQLGQRGGDMLDRLEAASEETSRAMALAADRLSSNLKSSHIGEEFAEIADGLEDMMAARLDRVAESFSEKSLGVVDLMVGRSQALTDAIVETSNELAEAIATRADEVNSTLRTSGESLLLGLDLRGSEVATKLEQAGGKVTQGMIARSAALTDAVREAAEHVTGVMATRSEALKEMMQTRLSAFEEMFGHTGTALGERIARDSSTLGNLITRHLAEFDRTVKTYGAELVERLGARTQDVSESMRSYLDSFDNRVATKATEVSSTLDQRLSRFQETLESRAGDVGKTLSDISESMRSYLDSFDDRVASKANEVSSTLDQRLSRFQETFESRSEALTTALSTQAGEVGKTLSEGGKELIGALDKRITDVTTLIDTRTAKLGDTIGERIARVDATLGKNALEVVGALDNRVAHLEQLLVGRAEAVVQQMEVRSRAAADLLNSRLEQLSDSIKTNSTAAERALTQLAANTTEALGKSAAASTAATEALNRSAAEATVSLNRSAGALSNTIVKSATSANEAIGKAAATAAELLARTSQSATDAISKSSQSSTDAIVRSTGDAERKLVGMSSEVSRNIAGKADEMNSALAQRVDEMGRILDEKSSTLISALTNTSNQFSGHIERITEQTVKSIDAKGFVFTQVMMDKSEEIARLINDASLNATAAVTRTLGQMQEGAQGVTEAAKSSIVRTLDDLQRVTAVAIEQSKQTATATVSELTETHTMLRSDSTALFERLREANILLQEVLSGAQENMSSIEHTMAARVSEFVAAMTDLSSKTGATTSKVEEHLGHFNTVTGKVLGDLGELAGQFGSHGRTLADAVSVLESGNRRTEESIAQRKAGIETLVSTLDTRAEDFGQRLQRFSSLLDDSLQTANARAREIAGLIAQTSNESVQTIEQQYELVRKTAEEERTRTGEALTATYDAAFSQVQSMFTESTARFSEVMQGMKQMAAEMQQELETTREQLRRGVLELPQETAENTAQMRRVIVDQIEALAELNRIVARHGRALDAAEPVRRDVEPLYAAGGGRAQARPVRADISGPQQAPARDITGAPTRRGSPPTLSPVPGGKDDSKGRNGGWLSELLVRASREGAPQQGAPVAAAQTARGENDSTRDAIESLDALSVDIAGMIDNDAAADLWERYKRGERGAFTKRLYTAQGQRAFEEIRGKYRSDPEFRQSVEHYIHEFERLLDDASRGDRGPAVARNYLTSDTGKVYTMLAHAAGRFD